MDGRSILEVVTEFAFCYAGLRSILVKLNLFNTYANFLNTLQATTERRLLFDLLANPRLPRPLNEIGVQLFFRPSFDHSQQATLARFGRQIQAFTRKANDVEAYQCHVCSRLRRQSQLQGLPRALTRADIQPYLAADVPINVSIRICQTCVKSLRNLDDLRMPLLAVNF